MFIFLALNHAFAGTLADANVLIQSDASGKVEAFDRFGDVLAVGDFNGDGFEDLAVSSPFENTSITDTGFVTVHYGGTSGVGSRGTEKFTQTELVDNRNEPQDRFGEALAVGDFNCDGFDDLAVGTPFEDFGDTEDVGMVGIFLGSSQGLLPGDTRSLTQRNLANEDNVQGNRFGWALATGDFDADGFDDLAVGVPGEDLSIADSGRVGILYGGSSTQLFSRTESMTIPDIGGSLLGSSFGLWGDAFGFALAAGDFDADGFADLAVGAPARDVGSEVDAGQVAVVFGASGGLLPANAEFLTENDVTTPPSAEHGDMFGSSLAVGDLDGDGFDDLAVGAPRDDISAADAGRVNVFYGGSRGRLGDTTDWLTNTAAGERREQGDQFGFGLAIGDLDGDGSDDLLVGIPFEDDEDVVNDGSFAVDRNGAFAAFFGSSGGLFQPDPNGALQARADWWQQRSFGGAEEAGDRFGWALAAGDFNGDGLDEVAVGVPFESVRVSGETLTEAGAVYVATLDPAMVNVDGAGAIVIDRNDGGRVLGALRPDGRRAMASTTKMMTALLISEAITDGTLTLDTVAEMTPNVSSFVVPVGGVTLGLQQDHTITVQDLLYATMVSSSNDAATLLAIEHSLARGISVTNARDSFVDRMNERARQLGLTDTSFANPHGRDPEDVNGSACQGNQFDNPVCAHYSTPRDLAALADFAMNDALFARLAGTQVWFPVTWTDQNGQSIGSRNTLCSTNLLIRSGASGCPTSPLAFPGAYGVKTGNTDQAGPSLVSAATSAGGRDVMAVVLNAGGRTSSSANLLRFGFSQIPLGVASPQP